jgi:predicted cupin superfamily sugar epimerase
MVMGDTKERAEDVHEQIERYWEHDQEWAECIECGAQWSIVECIDEWGQDYEDFELVTDGDGFCEERAASESW